ncbi:DoxX family protein [Chryseobacterium sp. MMS23-Vi53]|uniref:DoxX family protein n=1 Tax=Chryseobacterium sp. MMS23-Vi53 TaxID=3386644 RepID=UPI0039E7ED81
MSKEIPCLNTVAGRLNGDLCKPVKPIEYKVMKNKPNIISVIICYFLILLWVYAGVSKLADFENFQIQLAQSPLLGDYSVLISYVVILTEFLFVFLLAVPKVRLTGLYGSLGLMSAFTVYIYLIVYFSESIPCSCGGILEKMDWNDHLIFNILCIVLILTAIFTFGPGAVSKKRLMGLAVVAIGLPSLVPALLFYPHLHDNEGNFTRKIVYPLTDQQRILEFPADHYYFAGNRGDTLFLGQRKTPLLLSTVMPEFNNIQVNTLRLNHYKYPFVSATVNVLYPYFSVSDGKVPAVFEGKLPSLEAHDIGIYRLYFSRFYMLRPQQYIFKTMLVKTKESELGILHTAPKKYHLYPDVLQSHSDGIFDTDGDITVDHDNQQIVYTHLYRNEIITTDFNLGHVRRTRTIDSLSHTVLETKILTNGQTKLLRSPTIINRIQAVSNHKFYNVSSIRGKNESYSDARKNHCIDVYDALTKKYLYSFYIKKNKRSRIKSILATKHYLYVLSGSQLTRYTFK